MAAKKHTQEKTHEAISQQKPDLGSRGRIFEGIVVKKFPTRVVIEQERTLYMYKYERFYKKIMRLHARLPAGIEVEVGDLIRVRECRPLSKIIHAIVVEVVKKHEEVKK